MLQSLFDAAGQFTTLGIFLRLGTATLAGILIGIEREAKNKAAGIKTHVLVCVGSALCLIVGQYVYLQNGGGADITRIGSSVVSGVGFLGVGTIIVTGVNEVRGLTTAAGLWASACIGLAAGIGYLEGTLMSLAFVLFTFVILRRIDSRMHLADKEFDLYVELETNRSVKHLLHHMRRIGANYTNLHLKKSVAEGDGPIVTMHIKLNKADELRRQDVVELVDELDYVYYTKDY